MSDAANMQSYLVVGLGKSGVAAAKALLDLNKKVGVYDEKAAADLDSRLLSELSSQGAELYLGKEPEDLSAFDVIVMSPGVSQEKPLVQRGLKMGIKVTGELELAWQLGGGNYVAITGTNGKTTTTSLIGDIFKASGKETYVVGNIGTPVISASLEADDSAWLITECSSFQLETAETFRPGVSLILNITPDHLDRHKTMECYAETKGRVFQAQTEEDFLIINEDDSACKALLEKIKPRAKTVPFSRKKQLEYGAFVKEGNLVFRSENGRESVFCNKDELLIPGTHNLENALAALSAAVCCGIPDAVIRKVLTTFKGVEHRMEFCGEINGIRFVNDSKGTNPDSSIKTIEAINGKILLIAGGYDKKSSFDQFIMSFSGKVKALLLLGQTAETIKETAEKCGFTNSILLTESLQECVRRAYELAQPGDTVLLSPACASWGMYENFEQRGRHFKECVQALQNEEQERQK